MLVTRTERNDVAPPVFPGGDVVPWNRAEWCLGTVGALRFAEDVVTGLPRGGTADCGRRLLGDLSGARWDNSGFWPALPGWSGICCNLARLGGPKLHEEEGAARNRRRGKGQFSYMRAPGTLRGALSRDCAGRAHVARAFHLAAQHLRPDFTRRASERGATRLNDHRAGAPPSPASLGPRRGAATRTGSDLCRPSSEERRRQAPGALQRRSPDVQGTGDALAWLPARYVCPPARQAPAAQGNPEVLRDPAAAVTSTGTTSAHPGQTRDVDSRLGASAPVVRGTRPVPAWFSAKAADRLRNLRQRRQVQPNVPGGRSPAERCGYYISPVWCAWSATAAPSRASGPLVLGAGWTPPLCQDCITAAAYAPARKHGANSASEHRRAGRGCRDCDTCGVRASARSKAGDGAALTLVDSVAEEA